MLRLFAARDPEAQAIKVRQGEVVRRLSISMAPILVVNGDSGEITQANAAAYQLLGPPLVGSNLDRLVPEDRQLVHKSHRANYMTFPVARPMGVGIEVRANSLHEGKKDSIPVEIGLNPIYGTRLIEVELRLIR